MAATVPGFDWQAWQGIVAPGRHAAEVVARLAAELARVQATPEFREQLVKFGMEPSPPQTPGEFAAMIVAEQPRWAKAIQRFRREGRLTEPQQRGDDVASPVIDVHTHVLTEAWFELLQQHGGPRYTVKPVSRRPARHPPRRRAVHDAGAADVRLRPAPRRR